MGTTIRGAFKNIDNEDIYVDIVSNIGNRVFVIGGDEIKFSRNPVEIDVDCDKLTTHIIKKKCKVSLVTSIFLGDYLFTGNDRDVAINIYKNQICIFSGYVQNQSFTQPWANNQEEFELNCVDYLSTLQNRYIVDKSIYDEAKSQNNVKSFKDIMAMILPSYTYWDKSKIVDDSYDNVFDCCGVSMNAFLGESKDDIQTNDSILEAMLRYLNLHIIQEGVYMLIYDWNSVGATNTWYNIYDGSTITLSSGTLNITQDKYASDDTNISMNDIYNRVSVKAAFEKKDSVTTSPLDTKDIKYYNNYKQLWYSEIISEGKGRDAHNAFTAAVNQTYSDYNNIDWTDYKNWTREDWYMKWGYNKNWKLYYQKKPIEDWLEYDENGKVINQHRIMQALKQNKFMPALISVGSSDRKLTYNVANRCDNAGSVLGGISMSDYLVISVNGDLDDSVEKYNSIAAELKTSCGATNDYYSSSYGLFTYTGDSGLFSPGDDDTTNYLIFTGSMILNPVYKQSGWYKTQGGQGQEWYTYKKDNTYDIKFKELHDAIADGFTTSCVDISDNGDGALYSQQFYKCVNPAEGHETLDAESLMIYPFVQDSKREELEYNYSDHGDDTDKIDKLPILVCQMKIGDKYLVETYEGGNKQIPRYHWYTYEECPVMNGDKITTFTLGIDPSIGDKIIGKEYEISNTVDGRFSNEKGLAIPIKRSDALSGAVEFKILSVANTRYNEISRVHPTMFRHTSWNDNWKNLLSHVSSIWVKGFDIKIVSDNKGYDVDNENTDLVYYSNVNNSSIKEMDMVEFPINTQPDTNLLLSHGISSNISNTNVVNMNTNVSVKNITETLSRERAMAEHLYINQYYELYSTPRAIIESTLTFDNNHPMLQKHRFSTFGTTLPLGMSIDLKDNTYKIKAIQK